ncbi:MAG: cytochrome b/b6 domain-containing protein [Pseudomonadota bacterium]
MTFDQLARTVQHAMPRRRTALKWLHWSMVPLLVWFVLVQPSDVARVGPAAVRFHSVMGLIFVSGALLWTLWYLKAGLASRPGPKLPALARPVHWLMHRTIIWGLFTVALTGFLLGLSSAVLLWAGGIVPIAPPMNWPRINDLVGKIHAVEFYALSVLILGHAAFHIWRHLKLGDNALRIMAPKVLHRWL